MALSRNARLTLGLIALALVMACAKPPTQEMTDAENAVNGAIQAGAEQYAAEDLAMAQDILADAKAKLESKDYKGAKMAALEAKAKADTTLAAVEPNKQAAKVSAEERMASLKPMLETAAGDAQKVRGKDAMSVKDQAKALTEAWGAIQADFDGGSYNTANVKLDEAQAKLDELKAAIEAAKPAAGKKK